MQEEAGRFYPQLLAAWKRSISGDKFPSGNDCVREIGIAAAYASAIGIPSIVFFQRSINHDNPSARLHNHQPAPDYPKPKGPPPQQNLHNHYVDYPLPNLRTL